METVIYLTEVQKKSNGQLKKIKVIESYNQSTKIIPNKGDVILLHSDKEFVITGRYYFIDKLVVICVGYVLSGETVENDIKMIYDTVLKKI